MTTFKVGDVIVAKKNMSYAKAGIRVTVTGVENVPPERIQYNPNLPFGSGIGHHQMLKIKLPNGDIVEASGFWFED